LLRHSLLESREIPHHGRRIATAPNEFQARLAHRGLEVAELHAVIIPMQISESLIEAVPA
jgi:NOL1/NOP2/fmu family ribosome biogenesis protein